VNAITVQQRLKYCPLVPFSAIEAVNRHRFTIEAGEIPIAVGITITGIHLSTAIPRLREREYNAREDQPQPPGWEKEIPEEGPPDSAQDTAKDQQQKAVADSEREASFSHIRNFKQAFALASELDWPHDFAEQLVKEDVVRVGENNEPIIPIRDLAGEIIGEERRFTYAEAGKGHGWYLEPAGIPVLPLIYGRPLKEASEIHVFMGPLEALTLRLCFQDFQDALSVVATRGDTRTRVSKLLDVPFPNNQPLFVWAQNSDRGTKWSKGIIQLLGKTHQLIIVRIPKDFKSLVEWHRAGATQQQLLDALHSGERIDKRSQAKGAEAGQNRQGPEADISLKQKAERVVQECGQPVIINDEGRISSLKERFWARWYASDYPHLLYELREEVFYQYNPDTGLFCEFSDKAVREGISQALLSASRRWGRDWDELDKFNNTRVLNGIVEMLSGMIGQADFFNTTQEDQNKPNHDRA
jgi:hypothetical protein